MLTPYGDDSHYIRDFIQGSSALQLQHLTGPQSPLDEDTREGLLRIISGQCDYTEFIPRPDSEDGWDQQTSFINDFDNKFTICLGGTGSGKTVAAAIKTARYVCETPPPRYRCPFWVVGASYEQVCEIAWNEKLSWMIPDDMIHSISWLESKRNWPRAVLLKHPQFPGRIGWILEFKSYEQRLKEFKGRSIGGYWCNEEVPLEVVDEIQGRCRDYNSPGWADFTPVEVVSLEWPGVYDAVQAGLTDDPLYRRLTAFYHLDTTLNTALATGWADDYLASIPEDMRDTRRFGTFSVRRGSVFKEWNPSVHVIDFDEEEIDPDWYRARGVDFGFANPFVMLWLARTNEGRWIVYDEHHQRGMLNNDHATAIKQRTWPPDIGVPGPMYGPTWADWDPQQHAEFAQHGIVMRNALKGKKTRASLNPIARGGIIGGILLIRQLLASRGGDGKPMLQVSRKCRHLIREMPAYRWPEGTDKQDPNELPLDKDNHCIDAMRYCIFSEAYAAWADQGPGYVQHEWKPRFGLKHHRSQARLLASVPHQRRKLPGIH